LVAAKGEARGHAKFLRALRGKDILSLDGAALLPMLKSSFRQDFQDGTG
jgi:hypothetical protein